MSFNIGNKLLEIKFVTYLIGKGANGLIYFFSIPLFIKFCGLELYGKYVFIYTAFLMSNSIGTGWISQSVLKFSSKFENTRYFFKYSNSVNRIAIINSSIISLLFILVLVILNNGFIVSILLGICCFFSIIYGVKLVFNQSLLNSRTYVISELIRMLIYVFIPFIFLYQGYEKHQLEIIVSALLISYLIGNLFLNSKNLKTFNNKSYLSLRKTKIIAFSFFKYGFPLSIWMFLSPSANGVDRFLIKYFVGFAALAEYSALYDIISKVFLQFAQPLGNSAQPILMNAFNKNDDRLFDKTLRKTIFFLTIIFLILAVFFGVSKRFIIVDYLGFTSEDVIVKLSDLFLPLLISTFVWQLAIILQKIIEAKKLTIVLTYYMLITVFSSILLSILFLPKYGYVASAFIMLFSSLFYLGLIIYKLILLKHNESK